jgi:hypothetical protein
LCKSTADQGITRHIFIDIWRRLIFLIFRAVRRFVHVLLVKLHHKHMFINKVTMNIMINLIQMLLIFVFEIRPRDRLRNDSDAMTVFIIISLFPRDKWSELFNVGGLHIGNRNYSAILATLLITSYVHSRNSS